MFSILALYAILASTFTLGKYLLVLIPPFLLIGIRMILAGGLTLGFLYFGRNKEYRSISIATFFSICLLSIIHIFVPYCSEFVAMQSIAPSSAALIYNLSPFFSAFFSYFLLSEKMNKRKWLGFGLGFLGITYFAISDGALIAGSISPYFLMLISVASASLGWVIVRLMVNNSSISPLIINGIAMVVGGSQALLASSFIESWGCLNCATLMEAAPFLSLIILIANIIFYNFYGYLLKRYSATLLSFVGALTPLFTAAYDWIFLGEMVSISFFIASGIIFCGVYIFYKEELKQGYILGK